MYFVVIFEWCHLYNNSESWKHGFNSIPTCCRTQGVGSLYNYLGDIMFLWSCNILHPNFNKQCFFSHLHQCISTQEKQRNLEKALLLCDHVIAEVWVKVGDVHELIMNRSTITLKPKLKEAFYSLILSVIFLWHPVHGITDFWKWGGKWGGREVLKMLHWLLRWKYYQIW